LGRNPIEIMSLFIALIETVTPQQEQESRRTGGGQPWREEYEWIAG